MTVLVFIDCIVVTKEFKAAFKTTLGIEVTTHMLKVIGIMEAKGKGINDSTLAVITGNYLLLLKL